MRWISLLILALCSCHSPLRQPTEDEISDIASDAVGGRIAEQGEKIAELERQVSDLQSQIGPLKRELAQERLDRTNLAVEVARLQSDWNANKDQLYENDRIFANRTGLPFKDNR